jgi:hypothetical protein
MTQTTRALAVAAMAAAVIAAGGRAPAQVSRTYELARAWDAEHVSPPITPLVDHDEVRRRVVAIAAEPGGPLRVHQLGASLEGREIWDVSFGTGPFVVLMWSQMHGDEGTATSALFDVYEYIGRHRDAPDVRAILEALTVHTVPMLNPDGAQRWQRRNAQGLDVNRDALRLQSPEGQLLKTLRDDIEAGVGFNLHNQSWNTTVGRPPEPASISLLSVAFDDARSMNGGRLLTRRLAAVVRDALEPLAPGRIGRYDDGFEVRAFGDNITKWGTPVLLIETGPWPGPLPDPPLVRLNFIALIQALGALADGSVDRADPARYDALPENESFGFYILIRNATVHVSQTVPLFTADIGISANRRLRVGDGGRRELVLVSSVADLGDLRTHRGLFEIDASGKIIAPLAPGADVGTTVVPGPFAGALQVGAPADLMLLAPEGDRYRVERIFRALEAIK